MPLNSYSNDPFSKKVVKLEKNRIKNFFTEIKFFKLHFDSLSFLLIPK